MTTVIRAKHYDETEERLAKDPVIISMAKGLKDTPLSELVHDTGDVSDTHVTPRFEFMQAANREYASRGGKDGGHLGAVSHALLKILAQPEPPAVTYTPDLASVKRFVEAGVARGRILTQEAMEEFDCTGESGYTEGYAAGFAKAFQLVKDFME